MSKDMKKEIWEWTRTILLSVLFATLILQVIRPTVVKETSMLPTLEPNDYVMLERISHRMGKLEQGDIIVFKTNLKTEEGEDKNLIKRVIGIPGDHVVVYGGRVVLNDTLLEESYVKGDKTDGQVDIVIDENSYFVMGDNRAVSLDSRSEQVGMVDGDNIIGRAMIRLFPFDSIKRFQGVD